MSGLCSSIMNLNSLSLFVNVSAFKERQINLFFVYVFDLCCLFCGLFLGVYLYLFIFFFFFLGGGLLFGAVY